LTALLTTKYALQQVFARCWFQGIVKSVKQHIQELLGVFLLRSIGWLAIEFLE
jgi:hypothetical protein